MKFIVVIRDDGEDVSLIRTQCEWVIFTVYKDEERRMVEKGREKRQKRFLFMRKFSPARKLFIFVLKNRAEHKMRASK